MSSLNVKALCSVQVNEAFLDPKDRKVTKVSGCHVTVEPDLHSSYKDKLCVYQ